MERSDERTETVRAPADGPQTDRDQREDERCVVQFRPRVTPKIEVDEDPPPSAA